ncbi:DNA-binding response regulator, OmpR family, contains REC and winged-helix (wHTH) domain [Variovorax sp. PDC80]|uniref:response regulator transcription factor n=1 Tax=Variovorax sp. PDC80 TaxID=1882827 RepID=UPI0008EF03D7|nr:response regulator transcription factor [Variovorax sp. PDC80]SFP65955.1 DNA-binding response regulator, OmpR family, contains REC and winged-helix (wHTH) domain [Variovorax sp. PDC80]
MFWQGSISRGFHGGHARALSRKAEMPQSDKWSVSTHRIEMDSEEERCAEQPLQIALLGDDTAQAEALASLLVDLGYSIRTMALDVHSVEKDDTGNAGLFVLDLHRFSAEKACLLIERIRARVGVLPPVLLLSTELREDVIATLYAAGVDDVLPRPAHRSVFAARIQALARRAYPHLELPSDVLRVGVYAIDLPARHLCLYGQPVKLSRREFDLALYLFRNVGKLVTRTMLEKAIWGRELGIDSKTLDTHIYRLRVKLKLQPENGAQLASVYAQGFRLVRVVTSSGDRSESELPVIP